VVDIEKIKAAIRDVPDFPKEGILFKDITTLLQDNKCFNESIDAMLECVKDKKIDCIVGIESRGFIFGAVLAYKLGIGFSPVRKKGKLPYKTESVTYSLEYGEDTIEMHVDAVKKDARVLIVDDLLATGGTAQAVVTLVEKIGGTVEALLFLIELDFLEGRKKIDQYDVLSVIHF